jgi:hypothetical protein
LSASWKRALGITGAAILGIAAAVVLGVSGVLSPSEPPQVASPSEEDSRRMSRDETSSQSVLDTNNLDNELERQAKASEDRSGSKNQDVDLLLGAHEATGQRSNESAQAKTTHSNTDADEVSAEGSKHTQDSLVLQREVAEVPKRELSEDAKRQRDRVDALGDRLSQGMNIAGDSHLPSSTDALSGYDKKERTATRSHSQSTVEHHRDDRSGVSTRNAATGPVNEAAVPQNRTVYKELSKEQIQSVVAQGLPRMRRCYEHASMQLGVATSVQLQVSMRIAPSGRPTFVEVAGQSIGNMKACVQRAATGLRFPASIHGAYVPVPLSFGGAPSR